MRGRRLEPVTGTFAKVIAKLHRASFAEPWTAATIMEVLALRGGTGFLLRDGGRPAGFILARCVGGEADIISLAILPECRGRGLGTFMMEAFCAAMPGAGISRIVLEVNEHNIAARNLYRRAGFRQVGRRPGYYAVSDRPREAASREDALLLAKSLD
ncbi:MAG: ribosomal protein S18-alanine N-acetyltransferase [Alphaproteobacteria bacterium]